MQSKLTFWYWPNSVSEISSIAAVNIARRFLCAHLLKTSTAQIHTAIPQTTRDDIPVAIIQGVSRKYILYYKCLIHANNVSIFLVLTETSRKNKNFFSTKKQNFWKNLKHNTLTEGYCSCFREGRRGEQGLTVMQLCRNLTDINNSIWNFFKQYNKCT